MKPRHSLLSALALALVIGIAFTFPALTAPSKTVSYDIKKYRDFDDFKIGVENHLLQGYEVVTFTHGKTPYYDNYTVIYKRTN